jgi:3-isopropylmalate/(R)-2-methylmalate dehydratase small subunit
MRAVIASSFGDIFFENSFKNGLLTVILPAADLSRLRDAVRSRAGASVVVNLEKQTVTGPDGIEYRFEIDPFKKECLLSGQDEIGLTLARETDIAAFEQRQRLEMPWLF